MTNKGNLKEEDLTKASGGAETYAHYMMHDICDKITEYNSSKVRIENSEKQFYCDHCKGWYPASEFTPR